MNNTIKLYVRFWTNSIIGHFKEIPIEVEAPTLEQLREKAMDAANDYYELTGSPKKVKYHEIVIEHEISGDGNGHGKE